MGLYGFRPHFVPFIEDGSKTHTIRAERRVMDKPGNTMHLYVGLRTKAARLIFRAPCVKVEAFCMTVSARECFSVIVGGELLSDSECEQLARRDGFSSFAVMCRYWRATHGVGPFFGRIYHWDYERREGRK